MKKIIIAVVAIVVLVVVAALVAPFLIPTATYKDRLIALVKQSTGRDLTISGPVRLAFLPRLELDASDIAFANAPGAHTPDMLRLKRLEVQLKLLPLLHGAVAVDRFVLTDPVIALEIDKAGHPNWAFARAQAPAPAPGQHPSPGPTAAPAPAAPARRSSALSQIRLDDVRLVDGRLQYRDDRTGKMEQVDSVNMKLSLPSLDSPFAGEGSAVWKGEKVALSVGVAKPRALLDGTASGLSMHVTANPIDVGFTGVATGLPPARLTGTVDLTVPSLRGLATWVGATLPPGHGLGRFTVHGKLAMAGPKIAFTDAAIVLDAIKAQGALTLATGGVRPALTGKLQLDELNLNPYLPPEKPATTPAAVATAPGGPSGAQPAAKTASQGWSDAPLDLAALKTADADFALTAGHITYRKIEIGPSALTLHLKDGKLAADLTQLSLYQGSGQAKVTLDGSKPVPALAMSADLNGVAIGPLLKAAAGIDRLSGTGKLAFDVAGSGKSERALIGALNGKGAVDLANGHISGINLIALAENPTAAVTGKDQGGTDFGTLTGTFTIINGVLRNNDLQLKSGPIPVTGQGTVSLPARTVDYRLTVNLAGAVGIPVLVTGPWDNLSYRPDLSGLARQPGALLKSLKNLAPSGGAGTGGSVPSPGNLLKGLFGK